MAAGEELTASPFNIAVIGTGYWGKNYVRALYEMQPQVTLSYVCDANEAVLAAMRPRFPGVRFVPDVEELLAAAALSAIVVATPASTHFALARRALEAGKHVLVEKPMTTLAAEADELNTMAAARGLRVMVGFTSCFIAGIAEAQRLMRSEAFGRCYYITSRRTSLGIIRPDVNVAWDLVPHDLAILSFLTGSRPVSISAVGASFVSDKEDAVTVTIRYESGVTATVFASWAEPRKTREVVVVGSGMTIVADDIDVMAPLRVYHKSISREEAPSLPAPADFGLFKTVIKSGDLNIPELAISEPLKAKLAHFRECCLDASKDCRTSGLLGALVVRMLEAIDISMKAGGAPVAM